MTKATSSAVDFLAAVAGKTELFEVAGVTVELRSLDYTEVGELRARHGDDFVEMSMQAILLGLVSPKLDEAQLAQLRHSRPGPLAEIAARITEISGLSDDGPGASPLAGGGSS